VYWLYGPMLGEVNCTSVWSPWKRWSRATGSLRDDTSLSTTCSFPPAPAVARTLTAAFGPRAASGGLTALAGICAYDADLQGVAQRYFFHALRMAKASGDRGFGGYVVALLASQALYLGLHRQVIQYAETALRSARQHLTPALVTDLSTLHAKA
jgi:hypothetical protein